MAVNRGKQQAAKEIVAGIDAGIWSATVRRNLEPVLVAALRYLAAPEEPCPDEAPSLRYHLVVALMAADTFHECNTLVSLTYWSRYFDVPKAP